MGIEAIGSVVGTQNYQSKPVTKPVAEVAPIVSDAAQSEALNQAVAVGPVMASDDNKQDAAGNGRPKQENATMKDVNEFNKIINQNTVAEFGYNEPTNRITIKIKDKETNEVIKEIPSEKALEMLAKAWELAGLLVDEKR